MVIIRLLRPGLFVYEIIRILVLAARIVFEPADSTGFPRLVYTVPGAIFPLMALFIWIDITRYSAYIPLFIAGKCITLFSLFIWCILHSFSVFAADGLLNAGPEWVLLIGDLFAMSGILLINIFP